MLINFPIDNTTIIVASILIGAAIISSLMSPFFRFRKPADRPLPTDTSEDNNSDEENTGAQAPPPLSVILTPHDEADQLERHLPAILHQKYPAGFQVIVVVEKGQHEIEDTLTRLENDYKAHPADATLYITYIPETSRYMSRKKLGITLGVKAAVNEKVLLTEPCCEPASDLWLQTIAAQQDTDDSLVIGYGAYCNEVSSFKRFQRLYTEFYLLREAKKGRPYRTQSYNIMFNKSDFMKQEGFRGSLNMIRGEYDFIVNKYATRNVALVTDRRAWMIEDAPSRKTWLNKHLFYLHTRRILARSMMHRFWFNLDQTALHGNLLLEIAALIYGISSENVILIAASLVAFLISLVTRTILARKAARAFDEKIPALACFPYEISLVWHNLTYLIRYAQTSKLDFTTHKQ
ncbi:MAG: glycosyl transferase family 2 [Prevotella sp.]